MLKPIRLNCRRVQQIDFSDSIGHVPGRLQTVITKAVVIVWSRLIALWVL